MRSIERESTPARRSARARLRQLAAFLAAAALVASSLSFAQPPSATGTARGRMGDPLSRWAVGAGAALCALAGTALAHHSAPAQGSL